jgi:replicative DNA helicase
MLSDIVPSSASFGHYVNILTKNRIRRSLITAGNKIVEITKTNEDEQQALSNAEKIIFDIHKQDERKELTIIAEELPGVLERMDTIQKDPSAIAGLKTGFYGLDGLTNGLQKSDLIILAARPSVGKTSLALNIVMHAALKRKAKCAIFSLEMSKRSLALRALCSVAKVSLTKANRGNLSAEEWQRIWIANKELSDAGIYVDEDSAISPAEITRKCMRLKREQGLDLVMVDYLGLISGGSNKRESRQVEVADNSRAMKLLAKELDVPVLLLSQLNRGIEKRQGVDSRPVLSDLRESGAIEQDADIVMFIHKERTETSTVDNEPEEVELIIAKHRNGPLGTIKLQWRGEFTSFLNTTTDHGAYEAREKIAPKPPAEKQDKNENKKEDKKDDKKDDKKTEQDKSTEKKKSPKTVSFEDVGEVF